MPDLRWSLFAGEQLALDQAADQAAAAPNAVIENLYGPTELTISCTRYRLPADPAGWQMTSNRTVPVGRPPALLEAAVVAEDGAAAAEGELCVSGVQRFDGYLDQAQNAGRFRRGDTLRLRPLPGTPGLGTGTGPASVYGSRTASWCISGAWTTR